MSQILKSYGRAVLVAILPLVSIGETRWYAYLGAAAFALLGPAIRAADPTDPMFGRNA
jgi:hypothetical protein